MNAIYDAIELNESSSNLCYFNVMPNKFVKEELNIKTYKISTNKIEAIFDREYHSDMRKSPSHLIFLSVLIHSQKMFYIYLCHHFNIPYQSNGEERLKIWPTWMEVNLPKLITNEKDIKQTVTLDSLTMLKPKQYQADTHVQVSDRMWMKVRSHIYLI